MYRFVFVFMLISFTVCQTSSCDNTIDIIKSEILNVHFIQNLLANLTYTNDTCGNDCTYQRGFSCLGFDSGKIDEIKCVNNTFCIGRMTVSNNCRTLECCEVLNKAVLPQIQSVTHHVEAFNYELKFMNGKFNQEISCELFVSHTTDTCIQFFDYGNTDSEACVELQDLPISGSDTMAFDLF